MGKVSGNAGDITIFQFRDKGGESHAEFSQRTSGKQNHKGRRHILLRLRAGHIRGAGGDERRI